MSRSRVEARGRGGAPRRDQQASRRIEPAASEGLFGEALALHQAGRLSDAEPLYGRILEADRGHFDARHNLGIIHYQRGEHIAALRQIDAALDIDPNATAAHNNRGVTLAALERLEEAVESYGRAVSLKPDYVDALLNQGNALKALGRLDAALASYGRVIALAPGHAVAFAKRGNVLHGLQRFAESLASYDRAIALEPEYGEAWNNRGAALARLGRAAEAAASYDRAIALRPGDADAFYNRGLALVELGRRAEALASYDRAIALSPENPEAHSHRGNVLYELGRFAEALASYDRAITLKPDHAEAHCNRGNALCQLRHFEEGLASYDRTIALAPAHADAINNRGNALYALQRYDEALASYDKAIGLKPDYPDALNNRGNALRELKRFGEALASHERAMALNPEQAEYHNNRAIVLAYLKRLDEALASYAQAIALKPDYVEAYNNRGFALRDMRRFDEALASFAQAQALAPDYDYLRGTCLHARIQVCDWTGFDRECAAVLTSVDDGKAIAIPFQLLPIRATPEQQLRCARTYGSDRHAASLAPVWRGERYAHRRIRIAYLSADLRDHPVMALTAGLFARHDRSRFETVAISFKSDTHNRVRELLSAHFDRFIDAQGMSDRQIAALVRELEIDIAVDLNGYTEGARSRVFAHRPAPVQINYLGYAGTLGQSHWDYILADRFVIPEDSRAHYAEQVVHLPDCFMATDCDRRISARTPTRAEVGLPDAGFVFCCFNNSFKIGPDVFDIWMRLLQGVPGSVLWLSGTNASAIANLRGEAERRGVAADRLVFAERVPSNEDHLARVRLAALFLDTRPYNAHSTAADALWAGVPVLTCPGSTMASRVAGSLLRAVGLPELIAPSLADYEVLALRLAREPQRLAMLRHKLARNRERYPLFDTERFTRHIEAAYTTMWERAERGEPPQSFAVAAEPLAAG